MAERDLTYQDLLQILQLVEESTQFSDFRLKYGDIELELRKNGSAASVPQSLEGAVAPAVIEPAAAAQRAEPVAASTTTVPTYVSDGSTIIKSPMVGTFYRASEPGAKPFVTVGQRVEADSVVCILEVMKLMNSIPAGVAGVVTQILVSDGEVVEFGQPLVVIEPAA